jgi:hypothetical protein
MSNLNSAVSGNSNLNSLVGGNSQVDVATCGECEVNHDSRLCSICLEYMCAGNFRWRSFCEKCCGDPRVSNLTLDPVTRQKLPKCKCGKVWNGTCGLMSMCNDVSMSSSHKLNKC